MGAAAAPAVTRSLRSGEACRGGTRTSVGSACSALAKEAAGRAARDPQRPQQIPRWRGCVTRSWYSAEKCARISSSVASRGRPCTNTEKSWAVRLLRSISSATD